MSEEFDGDEWRVGNVVKWKGDGIEIGLERWSYLLRKVGSKVATTSK